MDAAITFILPAEDKARIKRFARAELRTVSNWVRAVIEAELQRRETLSPSNPEPIEAAKAGRER